MKALSIRQPWAWLIIHGFKPLENRSWNTQFRGRFFVHAGLRIDLDGYKFVADAFPDLVALVPPPSAIELGGLVGHVELVECRAPGAVPASNPAAAWYQGQYAFMLERPVQVPFVPMKGRLGFFDSSYAPPELFVFE